MVLISLQVPLSASMSPVRLHSSNPNLCAELGDYQPPVSRLSDSVEYASDYIKLQEEFCTIAQKGKQAATEGHIIHWKSFVILDNCNIITCSLRLSINFVQPLTNQDKAISISFMFPAHITFA